MKNVSVIDFDVEKIESRDLVEVKDKKNSPSESIKFFYKEEMEKIFSDLSQFHEMMFLLLYETGARVTEALSIRFKDLDTKTRKIRIQTLKQKKYKARYLYVSNELLAKIVVYRMDKNFQEDDFILSKTPGGKSVSRQSVFQYMQKLFKRLDLDIKKAYPHTFRHTRAVDLLENGMELNKVQYWLGHSSIVTTAIYLTFANQHLKESVDKVNIKLGLNQV